MKRKPKIKKKPSTKGKRPHERRKTARKTVLETFHVFLVIPQMGFRKLYLTDVSEGGVGFSAETSDSFPIGAVMDVFFYINANLKVPLKLQVVRSSADDAAYSQKVGCQFKEANSKAHAVFRDFLKLLDDLTAFI